VAVAFPQTQLDIQVQIALGADLTDTALSFSWTDVTSYVLVSDLVIITRGRGDEYSTSPPSTCRLTVNNTDGRWTRTNPVGAWYGQLSKNTPLRVRVNAGAGYVTRFTGFVDELPPRWDKSGNHAFVPITASGLLRRIRQGGALRSALFRASTDGYFSTGVPVAYWSCEDASSTTSIASGIGGPPMLVGGETTFASDSTIAGSDPLPVVSDTSSWAGAVPTYTSATTWAIRWLMKIPSAPASTQTLLRWTTAGSLYIWQLNLVPGGTDALQIEAYNTALVEQLGAAAVPFDDEDFYDRQLYFEVNATQNGTAVDWDYNYWFGTSGAGNTGSEASATIGNVQSVRFGAGNGAADLGGATLGHIAVATDSGFGASSFGATGFAAEETWARFQRLLAEENIAWGNSGPATPMGPQPTASLQSQLAEIEATEAAPIYEGTNGWVTLTQRQDRYNSAVALTLDHDAGEWAEPPEPTDDDQRLHNDVTASRTGGSSARATQLAGPNRTSAVGVYTQSLTLNPQYDSDLPYHAQWARHLGTVDELRFPRVVINLARATSQQSAWLACDINSRIQLTNPPSQLAPDTIDLLLEGYTETLGPFTWLVNANTSPAAPWQVFELEDDDLGRLDTAGSSLVASATAGATSLLVATSSGPPWSTTAEPYNWHIAGEQLTVTAMTTATPAFIASGAVAHGNNASVVPGLPAGMTVDVGQVIIGMAAIRNSGTGVPDLPAGYTNLALFGNVRIFGKYYVTGDAAPTVSFTGGVANADTSARLFGFSGLSLELDDAQSVTPSPSSQLNSSAANIAFPSLVIARANCVALLFAWKQDDWTSVATPSSMDAEIADNATTTGDDQGIAAYYDIQTTATSIVAGSLSVTGGAAAISRAVVLALRPLQTATVTRAVNGVSKAQSAGADVMLWRPGVGGLAL
jgi:hypothetical protein